MSMKLGQGQVQVQAQQMKLSPVQALAAGLTELQPEALAERIEKELEDNQWLERKAVSRPAQRTSAPPSDSKDYADTFHDHLTKQAYEYDLSAKEREVVAYLIGSLETDGLLRTPLSQLCDDMDIYQALPVSVSEAERLLTEVVQRMEPAGVGARSVQECLLLQAERHYEGEERRQMVELVTRQWDNFSHMRWAKIQEAMHLDDRELEALRQRVRRLTPRPGGSVGTEQMSDERTLRPDFTLLRRDDGRLSLSLNEADLPALTLSPDAEDALARPLVTAEDREAVRYMKGRIASARMFLEALEMRRTSMVATMKAIVKLQPAYFRTGDTATLRPMRLEDVAQEAGLDISTVSRVVGRRHVETEWGTTSLRTFFTTGLAKDGAKVSVASAKRDLKELIDNEAPGAPLTDEELCELMKQKGYDVARRTVAKYRTQLGIPESRLR